MELTGRLITSFSTSLRVSSSSALNQNSIKSFHSSVSLRASGTNVPKKNKASASQLKTGGFRRKTAKSKAAAGGKGDTEEGEPTADFLAEVIRLGTPKVKLPKNPILEEEKAMFNKYQKQMREVNEKYLDELRLKRKLRGEAMSLLPERFQAQALMTDDASIPEAPFWWFPTQTVPPIYPPKGKSGSAVRFRKEKMELMKHQSQGKEGSK
eukprot:TRINITY_DN5901_c0_g2_i1.p1 TRINITY_DN5901_c0_g2~~TRINITY_DN5901_c0_g2_i1.p1  ORF type:complete len:210 (-),score=37.89 TRINITY_DN5901_c0_g2_i1:4-633(-)